MPRRLPDQPRTRVEEVLRARGLTQAEITKRSGWQPGTVSKIVIGRSPLNAHNQAVLARLLGCEEYVLHQPMGSEIPAASEPTVVDDRLELRLAAVLAVFGLDQPGAIEGLLRFIATGDYGGLSQDLRRHLKNQLRRRP